MNFLYKLKCDICGNITNCRFGVSNRDVQPLSFLCKKCESILSVTLHLSTEGFQFSGCQAVEGKAPFDEKEDFVDLHLDFPVSFEKYKQGNTPFMSAIRRVSLQNYIFHCHRLNTLNNFYSKKDALQRLVRIFRRNIHYQLFENLCKSDFNIQLKSHKPEDINAAIYLIISKIFHAFLLPGVSGQDIEIFTDHIKELSEEKSPDLNHFIKEITDSGFLDNFQYDCLNTYPQILAAEMPIRPALFLDFDESYSQEPAPYRVSLDEFNLYKDLYKDLSEIISRGLNLVAALNNLIKRGDHNQFKNDSPNYPRSIDKFADIPFGLKMNFIDDSWYSLLDSSIDNKLRNAIAHHKIEYNHHTQVITYFPDKEGMRQQKGKNISFLDFMYKILTSFREVNRLNQFAKCLIYYRIFNYPSNT